LPLQWWSGLDAHVAAPSVEQTRILAEIRAQQAPRDAQRIADVARREYADVEKSVIRANRRAKGDPVAQHGAKVGNHDCRRLALVDYAVNHDSRVKKVTAHHGSYRRKAPHQRVTGYAQALFHPFRRFRDHRRVDANARRHRESAPGIEPTEVDD